MNQALIRLLLACSLAKSCQPSLDIRKPTTGIPGEGNYSGRSWDETYIQALIRENDLPCNPTTAFLTPALRNLSTPLNPNVPIAGRTPTLYRAASQILEDVELQRVRASDVLAEVIRILLLKKITGQNQIEALFAARQANGEAISLSSARIVALVQQHLKSSHSSRLPVLIFAAAYASAGDRLGERALPVSSHNAADSQTGAIGDLEITLVGEDKVLTGYEMKMRRVTRDDIHVALNKILDTEIQNYIFITTEPIDQEVVEFATGLYEQTGGIEIAVLDCMGFLSHFLHLFHRRRQSFVEAYETLVMGEPESAVGQELKVAWLALRQAAEATFANSLNTSEEAN